MVCLWLSVTGKGVG